MLTCAGSSCLCLLSEFLVVSGNGLGGLRNFLGIASSSTSHKPIKGSFFLLSFAERGSLCSGNDVVGHLRQFPHIINKIVLFVLGLKNLFPGIRVDTWALLSRGLPAALSASGRSFLSISSRRAIASRRSFLALGSSSPAADCLALFSILSPLSTRSSKTELLGGGGIAVSYRSIRA